MSKSENVALHKYLTRPARPELPAASSERQMFARGTTIKSQLSVDDYVKIVKEMVADPNYRPTVNLNAKEVGRIPNFEKAKDIVKEEMGSGFTQAYQRNLNRGRKVRAKEKRKVDPELKAKYLASKAERRTKGRIEKLGKDVELTPKEKFLNFQQRLISQQLNEKIRQNPDLILKNEELMEQLSTTVDKDGNLVKVKPTLEDIKNRGIFEIEHQRDIYKKGKMKDFPYNRNLILGPYNRTGGFKATAEKFIEANPDPDNVKVQAIIKKADDLGITIRPNVPEGTFPTKALGYKQAPDPINKFIDVAKKVTPALASNDLGIPSYKKDIDMAKKALGVTQLKSEFFPGARTAGELIESTIGDFAAKRIGRGLLKTAGIAGVGYGIYDTGVALQEGKSLPETAFRFFGLDPVYNTIREYNRLPEDAQEIQKKLNAQMSFDAAQDDPLAEGRMQRPEVTNEEQIYLDQQKQIVRETVEKENQARAEGRSGIGNMIRQKFYEITGQPYSMSFANGGRVQLKDGGKPINVGRRKFIKGAGYFLAAIPFLGKVIKPATKAAPEVIEAVTRTADQIPTYLTDLISKVKMMGKSKLIGKYDNPDGYVEYELGDYKVVDSPTGTRINKIDDRGEYGYNEYEMELRKDPETGALEYDEYTASPDFDGKMKDVDEGIEDNVHEVMKKFAYED